jgi:sugar O-acyltransferase (sialic acid O-acetyltransferase NeuD family)
MTMAQGLILLGGGGHAAVVTESARSAGFIVLGHLDDKPDDGPSPIIGFKRLGAIADLPDIMKLHRHAFFHAAIGDATLRRTWLDLPAPRGTPAVIDKSALVSSTATVADGAFIGPRAVVNARARIGRGAIINTGAIVEHDCIVGDFSHIAPGSVLAGRATVGEMTLIGAGSVVIPGVHIGSRVTLGAGAVAVSDIADDQTAIGVPARSGES